MRRMLILGGTGWLGREVARVASAGGAEVVCLARGVTGSVPEGVRFVSADRTDSGAYDQLEGEWDAVVELASAPQIISSALDALAERTAHWTLVSSVSVYERNDEPGADESAQLVTPNDPDAYADSKVMAEQESAAHLTDRLLIARPGLIVGPGDPTDRFGYWPARLHHGGRVLTPETAGLFVQPIDVTDLAEWIVGAGTEKQTGVVNAVGASITFESFLGEVRHLTEFDGELLPASDEWLFDREVSYWVGPRSLPLWLPQTDAAFAQRSNTAYLEAGGNNRLLRETISRVLQDELARDLRRPRRAGLTQQEEADLVDALPG